MAKKEQLRYIKFSHDMLVHSNYIKLSLSAKVLLMYMKDWALLSKSKKNKANKSFKYSTTMLTNLGVMTNKTQIGAFRELEDFGFIEKEPTTKGGTQRWSFSNKWRKEKEVKTIKTSTVGYVYLAKLDKHYKIGISQTPESRLREFTKLPYELETIFIEKVKKYEKCEEELHLYFADKRVRGEWFELEKEDIEFIKNYLEERRV